MSQIKLIYQKNQMLLYSWFYMPKRVTRAGAQRLSAWATQLRTPKIYPISGESLATLCPIQRAQGTNPRPTAAIAMSLQLS